MKISIPLIGWMFLQANFFKPTDWGDWTISIPLIGWMFLQAHLTFCDKSLHDISIPLIGWMFLQEGKWYLDPFVDKQFQFR